MTARVAILTSTDSPWLLRTAMDRSALERELYRLKTDLGFAVCLTGIEKREETQTVFNFSVHELECYAVGNSRVLVRNTNGPEAAQNAQSVKAELSGLPGKSRKTGPIKNVPDAKALDDLFNSLSSGGKTVNPGTYPGVVKQLPDGTIIRRRPGSKSGSATLDITLPDGTIIKVHIST